MNPVEEHQSIPAGSAAHHVREAEREIKAALERLLQQVGPCSDIEVDVARQTFMRKVSGFAVGVKVTIGGA